MSSYFLRCTSHGEEITSRGEGPELRIVRLMKCTLESIVNVNPLGLLIYTLTLIICKSTWSMYVSFLRASVVNAETCHPSTCLVCRCISSRRSSVSVVRHRLEFWRIFVWIHQGTNISPKISFNWKWILSLLSRCLMISGMCFTLCKCTSVEWQMWRRPWWHVEFLDCTIYSSCDLSDCIFLISCIGLVFDTVLQFTAWSGCSHVFLSTSVSATRCFGFSALFRDPR